MSDGILTVTGFARFEKLHAEYNKLQQEVTKLNAELKKTQSESKRGDDTRERSMSSWRSGLQGIAAQYIGIQAVIRAVTSEAENLIRIQERARQSDMSLSDAKRQFLGAVGPRVSDSEAAFAMRQIEQMAKSSQMPLPAAFLAGTKVLSATEGAISESRLRRVTEAISSAAPMFRDPEKIGELGDFAGAALDLQKGIPGLSPKEATGILFATLSQARLTDITTLKNLIPAAVGAQVTRPGVRDQRENTLQALAMAAALGGRIGDPTGELTRTAIATLAEVVAEEAPQFGDMPILDAVEAISQDRPLAERVKANVKGRGTTKPAQREFFDQLFTFEAAKSIRPELAITGEMVDPFLRRIDTGTPELQRSTTMRAYAAREQERIRQQGAVTGNVRALLFGGQIGEEMITGALPEAAQFRTGTFLSRPVLRGVWETLVAAGADPTVAARYVAEIFRSTSAKRAGGISEDPRESQVYEELYRSLDLMPNEPAGRESRIMEEIYKQRQASEQQAVTTQNALQGAAAAAQGKNQQE